MFSSGDDAAAKNKFGMTVSVFAGFLVRFPGMFGFQHGGFPNCATVSPCIGWF
jgi:hypothetical protein